MEGRPKRGDGLQERHVPRVSRAGHHREAFLDSAVSFLFGRPRPVSIKPRKLPLTYEPRAFEHTSKHSYAGTRPSWVKRSCVLPSFLKISKTTFVPVHSVLSSVKLKTLSNTSQTTFWPGM